MPNYLSNLKLVPNSSINVMTFVCIDGAPGIGGTNLCRQATGANDQPIAVSQVAYDLPPNLISALTQGTATYNQVAALAGEQLQTFFGGDVCGLQLAASCTAGSALGVTGGAGVVAGAGVPIPWGSGLWAGAIALQPGNAGEVIEVLTWFGKA